MFKQRADSLVVSANIIVRSAIHLRSLFAVTLLALAGCTPNAMYHTSPSLCWTSDPAQDCRDSSLQEIGQSGDDASRYLLSYVEFDEQGIPFDPGQQTALFDQLARESQTQDVLIVTFVHGWNHNAKPTDTNVQDFQKLLKKLAVEQLNRPIGERRRVFGVYVGWRGKSLQVPGVNVLTFWSRKDAARRVSEGSVRGLLGQLKAFRDALVAQGGRTKMLTIGHSFGAHVVYDAVAQYLMDQAASSRIQARYFPNRPLVGRVRERARDRRLILGYGDLVILVNPAIEAMRYQPLRLLIDETYWHDGAGRYAQWQPPIFVQVTSVGDRPFEGDWATGVMFPIGRTLSTGLEPKRRDPLTGESELDLALTAMGHHEEFWTHELSQTTSSPHPLEDRRHSYSRGCAEFNAFRRRAESSPGYLGPGWVRRYDSDAELRDLGNPRFNPNTPFWMVRARSEVISSHNAIEKPIFVDFIAQLSADIDRLRDRSLCTDGDRTAQSAASP